jgi:hypothetical protein
MAKILEEERLAALEGSEEYNWNLFINAKTILFF